MRSRDPEISTRRGGAGATGRTLAPAGEGFAVGVAGTAAGVAAAGDVGAVVVAGPTVETVVVAGALTHGGLHGLAYQPHRKLPYTSQARKAKPPMINAPSKNWYQRWLIQFSSRSRVARTG